MITNIQSKSDKNEIVVHKTH